jgi:hypothetical protein
MQVGLLDAVREFASAEKLEIGRLKHRHSCVPPNGASIRARSKYKPEGRICQPTGGDNELGNQRIRESTNSFDP